MAEEETPPAPPPPPPAPVLVHAWFPADPLPVPGEDEEAPARKPLDVILRDIPRRLKASAPVATQRRCRQALADARAKLEALGEPMMTTTMRLPEDELPLLDPEEIRERLEHAVDLVIDGGFAGVEPTTVVDLTVAGGEVIRAGAGEFD